MNILSYDYHSAFEPSVNHHSPLYALEAASEYNFDNELNIVSFIHFLFKLNRTFFILDFLFDRITQSNIIWKLELMLINWY